jgi:hypothetical protein
MSVLYSILLSLVLPIVASAQKVYFIYLQTDNNRPFYVKMNDQLISSASSGYLILSNLRDSTYNFSIGFPSVSGESKFSVPIQARDHGFLIKELNAAEALFDLQTAQIIRAKTDDAPGGISYTRRTDEFSVMLAKAAGDSTLLWQQVVKQPDVAVEKKEPPVNAIEVDPVQRASKETQVTGPPLAGVPDPKNTTPEQVAVREVSNPVIDSAGISPVEKKVTSEVPETVYERSLVKKHAESSTSEGFGLVFYDTHDGITDTIRLLIPNPRFIFIQPGKKEEAVSMLDQEQVQREIEKKDSVQKCANPATDQDFLDLRRDMAARMTDEDMVDVAGRKFNDKCFTTEQVRHLGALFLTPAGKYLFFSVAKGHLSDPEHFPTLQTEIRDDYYLKRFKALAGE